MPDETAAPTETPPATCKAHPGVAASATCDQCGAALCAACAQRSPVQQGTFCASCAQQLELAWAERHRETPLTTPVAAGALCAFHPDRSAASTCGRCGNFLCAACAIPSPWGDNTYCKDCLARIESEGGGGRIPWEDPRQFFLVRFWKTVGQVLFSPSQFFHQMPSRGYLPAITYLYHTGVYVVLAAVLLLWLMLPGSAAMFPLSKGAIVGRMTLFLGVGVLLAPLLQFLSAGWLHGHLWLFGGRQGYSATYRFTSYLSSIFLPAIVAMLLGIASRSMTFMNVLTILLGIYGIALLTIGATRAQRMPAGLAFVCVLLYAIELYLLERYVLIPWILKSFRGASAPFL